MKIIYKQGDLLRCSESFIVHGCNAQGVMGSGVAKQIKERYPEAYEAYKASDIRLGVVSFTRTEDDKFVFNAVTQEFYGREEGKVYVDYWAIKECFTAINWYIATELMQYLRQTPSVAMPKIGAGLGGGDWDIISKIIEEESTAFQPIVYEL